MPSYDYVCEECGLETLVIRPISESDLLPDTDLPGTVSCTGHKWKKSYKKAPQKAYGEGWGWSRKGSW